jgi:hypothetical protein
MNTGEYWENMGQIHNAEPITESIYFDDIVKMMIEEMKTGKDNSKMILSLLRYGAKDYIENCIDADHGQISEEVTEKFIDDQERARDVSETLRRTAASVYGDY